MPRYIILMGLLLATSSAYAADASQDELIKIGMQGLDKNEVVYYDLHGHAKPPGSAPVLDPFSAPPVDPSQALAGRTFHLEFAFKQLPPNSGPRIQELTNKLYGTETGWSYDFTAKKLFLSVENEVWKKAEPFGYHYGFEIWANKPKSSGQYAAQNSFGATVTVSNLRQESIGIGPFASLDYGRLPTQADLNSVQFPGRNVAVELPMEPPEAKAETSNMKLIVEGQFVDPGDGKVLHCALDAGEPPTIQTPIRLSNYFCVFNAALQSVKVMGTTKLLYEWTAEPDGGVLTEPMADNGCTSYRDGKKVCNGKVTRLPGNIPVPGEEESPAVEEFIKSHSHPAVQD